ncbi:MAG: BON domain-containing protein [Thermoanaerobaculia bacterium]
MAGKKWDRDASEGKTDRKTRRVGNRVIHTQHGRPYDHDPAEEPPRGVTQEQYDRNPGHYDYDRENDPYESRVRENPEWQRYMRRQMEQGRSMQERGGRYDVTFGSERDVGVAGGYRERGAGRGTMAGYGFDQGSDSFDSVTFRDENTENAGPHAGRGPRGYTRPDDRIEDDVCRRLTDDGRIDASGLTVHVENGEVTLDGGVDSRFEKRLAEDLVWEVTGVSQVHNHLRRHRQ